MFRELNELDEGHCYDIITVTDGLESINTVQFMKREGGKLVKPGVTNEGVIEMLLSRMQYLQKKLPCRENALAITKLEEALMWLEQRTKARKEQGVETKDIPHK